MPTSAQMLVGRVLNGGWRVIKHLVPSSNATGGNFSEGYIVENDTGQRAFLKALDYSRALRAPDPAIALQSLTEAFNFERGLLERCKARRMDRVVTAIDDGTERVDGSLDGGVVQYLIFELANGDVRSQVDTTQKFDLAFVLRTLHHVTTGMEQLHGDGIAHQDLKPSNVLVFDEAGSKIADLGRAVSKGASPPHEVQQVAGDPTYAPPELLYGQLDPDWGRRRLGCDAYLLGSMVTFFFMGQGMTRLLELELHPDHTWRNWGGTYEQVLPYLRDAFGRVVAKLSRDVNPAVQAEIVNVVRELCEPDPYLRGHPKDRRQANQFSLMRYIARFDLLAKRAEGSLLRNLKAL